MVDALDQAADSGGRRGRARALRRTCRRRRGGRVAARAGRTWKPSIAVQPRWRSADAQLRETDSVSALAFTLLALLLVGPVPALLARASWPMRAPAGRDRAVAGHRGGRGALGVQRRHRDRQPAVRARPRRAARPRRSSARSAGSAGRCGWPMSSVFALTAADRCPAGRRRASRWRSPRGVAAPTTAWSSIWSGSATMRPATRAARGDLRVLDVAAAAGLLPARRAQPRRGQRGHAEHAERQRGRRDPQPRAGPSARPPRPGPRDVHRGARRLPAASSAAPARWTRCGCSSSCSPTTPRCAPPVPLPWPGRWSPARPGRTPSGALAAGGPSTVLRVRRLSGRGNSLVLAAAAYLAAAAVSGGAHRRAGGAVAHRAASAVHR